MTKCNGSFSLYKISKPRFYIGQIFIDVDNHQKEIGLPKTPQRMVVSKNGKVRYNKKI